MRSRQWTSDAVCGGAGGDLLQAKGEEGCGGGASCAAFSQNYC